MKRVVLAGLLAGIAMFAWTSVAHLLLPLGTIGVQEMQNESVVLNAMHDAIGASSGMYLFPGMGLGPNPSNKEMRAAMPAYEKKLATSPSGLLIYHPPGAGITMTPRRLGVEFANQMIAAFLAVALLSFTRLRSFLGRVLFATTLGIVAAMLTNISYWNWYGFPRNYTAASMGIQIVGFLVVGLVAAGILGRSAPHALATSA